MLIMLMAAYVADHAERSSPVEESGGMLWAMGQSLTAMPRPQPQPLQLLNHLARQARAAIKPNPPDALETASTAVDHKEEVQAEARTTPLQAPAQVSVKAPVA